MLMMLSTVAFSGCTVEFDDMDDYLVGDAWHLVKTVYHYQSRHHDDEVYYADIDEVSMKFYYDHDVNIRTTTVGRFGRIYEDWIHGDWDIRNGELLISTRDGDWYYELYDYTNWHLVLSYTEYVEDEYGNSISRKVKEYYER